MSASRNIKKGFALLFTIIALISVKGIAANAQTESLLPINTIDSIYAVETFILHSKTLIDSGKAAEARILAEKAYQIASRNRNTQGQMESLMLLGKIDFKTGDHIRALYAFWQTIKVKNAPKDKGFSERIYYNMAVTFAALKKYPLALKYFQKSNLIRQKKAEKESPLVLEKQNPFFLNTDNSEHDSTDLENADTLSWEDDHLNLIGDQSVVVDADTLYIYPKKVKNKKEQKITIANIKNSFEDGQKGIAYGLIIHIKQPISGKRKTYSGINTVGHMFITLIKYNSNTQSTSRTFGFYPDKDNFLSATPIIPTSTATFKDDKEHDWDEIVAKFIPRQRFYKILRMVKKYSKTKYNLNKNNCTDFGLCIASIAGIEIKDTHGHWPLGSGNNPGFAGQSIIDHKIEDKDHDDLLILDAQKDNLQ